MKRIGFLVVTLVFFSSVAFASPLMDYSVGKGSIDLMWNDSAIKLGGVPESLNLSKKFNLDSSITLGFGKNLALQYRSYEPKAHVSGMEDDLNLGMQTYEINVLRKLNDQMSVFTGIVPVRFMENRNADGLSIYCETKNYWQVGVIGVQKLGPKAKVYEQVAAGSKWTNLEAGVSYPIAYNVEFNVNYRYIKAKDLSFLEDGKLTETAKGLGYGVTYKF